MHGSQLVACRARAHRSRTLGQPRTLGEQVPTHFGMEKDGEASHPSYCKKQYTHDVRRHYAPRVSVHNTHRLSADHDTVSRRQIVACYQAVTDSVRCVSRVPHTVKARYTGGNPKTRAQVTRSEVNDDLLWDLDGAQCTMHESAGLGPDSDPQHDFENEAIPENEPAAAEAHQELLWMEHREPVTLKAASSNRNKLPKQAPHGLVVMQRPLKLNRTGANTMFTSQSPSSSG